MDQVIKANLPDPEHDVDLFTVVTQWRQCLKSAPLLLLRATWESEIGYRQKCVIMSYCTHTEKVRKICHFYNLFIKKTLCLCLLFFLQFILLFFASPYLCKTIAEFYIYSKICFSLLT